MVYMAPERATGQLQSQENELSKRADIWSIGVILYCLIIGRMPFESDTSKKLYDNLRKPDISFYGHEWLAVPYSAKALLLEMLRPDACDRIDAPSAISHEFFVEAASIQEKYANG